MSKLRAADHGSPEGGLDTLDSSSLNGAAMVDKSMTGTFQLNLPKDLLMEAKRQPKPKNDQLRVDGWRNSWLSKLSELLVGKD